MSNIKKGKLLIISGFSGVGKGTVVKVLLKKHNEYKISISATTRNPRNGEEDGVHYYFKTKNEFEDMISNNKFLEYANYVGNYYGTPKDYVMEQLDNGFNVILEIETKGALKVKEAVPEALMIFILPPDAHTLKERLVGRQTEDPKIIAERLKKAADETDALKNYDYFVVNNEIDKCVDNVHKIVTDNKPELLDKEKVLEIKKDILNFQEGE